MTRIVVFQGSPRNPTEQPGQWGKTRYLMLYAVSEMKKLGVEVDMVDLALQDDVPTVLPCKGCISTAGGYHCHYPCDCYGKAEESSEGDGGATEEPKDFLSEHDVFNRVAKADGFAVFMPVHWYSVPTQVKAMFDRFVCNNLTLTVEQAHELMGPDVKDPKLTRPLSKSREHDDMLKNQWEGKTAAFFIHGDDGADDYTNRKQPKSLRLYPDSKSPVEPAKMGVMPIVQQCRYSGIEVPDDLVVGFHFNRGIDYATANDVFRKKKEAFKRAGGLARRLVRTIEEAKKTG